MVGDVMYNVIPAGRKTFMLVNPMGHTGATVEIETDATDGYDPTELSVYATDHSASISAEWDDDTREYELSSRVIAGANVTGVSDIVLAAIEYGLRKADSMFGVRKPEGDIVRDAVTCVVA